VNFLFDGKEYSCLVLAICHNYRHKIRVMLEKYCVLPSNRQTLYTSMVISAPASWASEFAMLSNDLLIHQALIY
jgi:hypothetical protein